MKKVILVLILLILFIFVLVLTNPTQEDYNSWVNEKVTQELKVESNGMVGKVTSKLTDLIVNSVSERHNYYIFSIYETNIADQKLSKTLGILKTFIKLD